MLKKLYVISIFLGLAKHTVEDIDINTCTHVIYSFAVLSTSTYEMVEFDKWLDIDLKNYENFVKLKQENSNTKYIIAIGGWTDSQNKKSTYQTLFGSSSLRLNFAKLVFKNICILYCPFCNQIFKFPIVYFLMFLVKL